MKIANDKSTFVWFWQELERTRVRFETQGHRFCINHLLKAWLRAGIIDWHGALLEIVDYQQPKAESAEEYIWEVCRLCDVGGFDPLPCPAQDPYVHRELLRAVISKQLKIGRRNVDLKALDEAYTLVYPQSTPINKMKKG